MAAPPTDPTKTPGRRHDRARAIEWGLGALSAGLILALAGYLVHEALTGTGSDPVLGLRVLRLVEHEAGHGVVVEVRNRGHATAANVRIAGLVAGDPLPREVTLDYVPADSTLEATLVFAAPVSQETLRLLVLGYAAP